jgi:hypothetical protein
MAIQSNEQFNLTLKPITSVDPSPYNKNYVNLPIHIFFFCRGSVILFYALKGSMTKKRLRIYELEVVW